MTKSFFDKRKLNGRKYMSERKSEREIRKRKLKIKIIKVWELENGNRNRVPATWVSAERYPPTNACYISNN